MDLKGLKFSKMHGIGNDFIIIDETKEEVARMKEKAQAALLNEKEQALVEVKQEVAQLSIQLAEKILSHELSLENQEMLIDQYIDGLGSDYETR